MNQVLEVAEGAHSILGPSSAERWINCPGSVLATKDMPDTPSTYAVEGTAAHTLSEWVRRENKPASEWLGTTIRVTRGNAHWDVEVDEEMVDSVQEFVDKVNEYPGMELIEARVSYEQFIPGGFGTLDSAKLTSNLVRVTDFKHGQGVKKYAKDNPQLMLYAVGVDALHGWVYDSWDKVVLAISQPRLDHYDEWETSLSSIAEWMREVAVPAAKAALSPGAPFKAGEHCQFCKIKATCKVRAQSVFEAAVGDFHDLDSATSRVENLAITVPLMSNEEVAKALAAWSWIEKWGEALKHYAMKEVMEGRAVGDFKIVAGRGERRWSKTETEVVEALIALGAKKEKLYSVPKLVSPAQAEKVVGKKQLSGLDDLVTKLKGKPTLVPGSDPRPVLEDATTDFDEITEE